MSDARALTCFAFSMDFRGKERKKRHSSFPLRPFQVMSLAFSWQALSITLGLFERSSYKFAVWEQRLSHALQVTLRLHTAHSPRSRGAEEHFIFSEHESYPKRLTTMIFAEVSIRRSLRYHHIMILALQVV